MKKASAVTRIPIEGELSIFKVADLRQHLLDALSEGREVEVDLSRVTEIDTAGIQLMLAAKREAAARSKPLRFTACSPAVLDIIKLFSLTGDFGTSVADGKEAA